MSSDKRGCLTECPQPGHVHLLQKQPVLLYSDPPVPWAWGHADLLFLGGDQLVSYSALSLMSGSFHSANARELHASAVGRVRSRRRSFSQVLEYFGPDAPSGNQ